jgi:stress-induced-phosphoprotein 1
MLKLMQHPETKDLFKDPTFMQKLQGIMQNPQLASVYMQQDPRLKKVFDVLSQESSPDDLENLTKQFDKQKFNEAKQKPQQHQHENCKEEDHAHPHPPSPPKKEEKKPEKMQT